MLVGRKVVLIPRGDRTRLMASEVPLMYGTVVEVVTVGVCEGEFKLCEVCFPGHRPSRHQLSLEHRRNILFLKP